MLALGLWLIVLVPLMMIVIVGVSAQVYVSWQKVGE